MAAGTEQKRRRDVKGSPVKLASESANPLANSVVPVWEWIVAGIGCLLVTGVIGFLLYESIAGNGKPPDIALTVSSVIKTGDGYLVNIGAVNQGGSTAEGVVVQGELRRGTESLEQSHTTIEYLPPHSKRRAGLYFTEDPRRFELKVRALGYEEP